MNKEVNFEIAKTLKEKGFDELCNNHYSQALFEGTNPDWEGVFPKYSVFKHSDSHYNSKPNNNDSWFECSAPTIADVVMWLYDNYGIWVYIKQGYKWEWYIETVANHPELKYYDGLEDSPTEAYEAAIKYTLENLI